MDSPALPALFSGYDLAGQSLNNRIVMAPMTRARAPHSVPTPAMAQYYAQRASAGLIISESAQVSLQGRGYVGTPGIHSAEQIAAWKRVTDAVHQAGGRIFIQLWHVGRLSHRSLLPAGMTPVGPVSRPARNSMVQGYDEQGRPAQVPADPPAALEIPALRAITADFRQAAVNALQAGFDGVEIHAGNGFLFEQFINAGLNTREDQYGGAPIANRLRLLLETVDAVIAAVGRQRVGVRVSPFAYLGDLQAFESEKATWLGLAGALCQRQIAYLHASHLGSGRFAGDFRKTFCGSFVLGGGMTADSAQAALDAGDADLIAFGTPFIANPDLAERLRHGWPLAEAGKAAFYGGGDHGFIDYPPYSEAQALA